MAGSADFPLKRSREEEENGVYVASTVSGETDTGKEADGVSAVIPGWFSEISPMWPGWFSLTYASFCFPFAMTCVRQLRNCGKVAKSSK